VRGFVHDGLPNHANKAPVENAVLNSDLEFSFLHPTVLFQNYAQVWPTIVETGVIAEPWSNKTRFSRVDYRDVAEVAAIALTEDRLLYGTFELCSEGWLDRRERHLSQRCLGAKLLPSGSIRPRESTAPLRPMLEHYDRTRLRAINVDGGKHTL
jgi:hypothetical protein